MEMVPPAQTPQPAPQIEKERTPPPPPTQNNTSKPKQKNKTKKKPSVDENGKKIIRRRKRKTYEQLQMLIKEFQANPDWTKDHMQEVSRKTGLSEAQVYKWGWDQKRKMMDPNHDLNAELKMYKKHQESKAQKSGVHKLKLSCSNKKSTKVAPEFQVPKNKSDKSTAKSRKTTHSEVKTDNKDNKENEYNGNGNGKPETRGIKRKLKFSNMKNKQNELFNIDN